MDVRCFLLMIFMLSQVAYSQHKKSYIFFETINSINVNFFYKKDIECDEIEPIERNLFLFNNHKVFFVEVENKIIKIDLRKYKEDKFFNVKLELNEKSKGIIYKYKRGDVISTEDNCNDEKCDILTIEFPKIMFSENQYHTTINDVFSKYILD